MDALKIVVGMKIVFDEIQLQAMKLGFFVREIEDEDGPVDCGD